MLDARLPHLPDDWAVWAFSDSHGVTSGLVRALREAGLIDDQRRWIAPPRTALVGCGDYIDRGRDIPGMVSLLRRLQREARAAGCAVVLARGNHEMLPLMAAAGAHEWLETWLEYGGAATVAAFGCEDPDPADPEGVLAILESCAPGHGPEDLGVTTDEHLWVRSGFFDTPWGSGEFEAYVRAGIERVVFGHTPQWDGPTYYHEGHSLAIDTNAVGNPRMPEHAVQALTLVGFEGSGSFAGMRLVSVPTTDAPDRMRSGAGR